MMADLTGGVTKVNRFSDLLIVDGENNLANPIENENPFDIRIVTDHLQDVFHFA
jgi:hypothetical protein